MSTRRKVLTKILNHSLVIRKYSFSQEVSRLCYPLYFLKKEKKEQNKQLYPFQENFQGILLLMSLDLLPMKAIN